MAECMLTMEVVHSTDLSVTRGEMSFHSWKGGGGGRFTEVCLEEDTSLIIWGEGYDMGNWRLISCTNHGQIEDM